MFLHGGVCAEEELSVELVSDAARGRRSMVVIHLAAALCSEVWQRWKRSSLRPCANANLVAILM